MDQDVERKRPFIVVGAIIMKDGKVLMHKRKGPHGNGTWSFPGGHLEFGESPEECARRETREETGIEIANIRKGPYTNDVHVSENKHYITIYMLSDYASGEPQILEPDKCEEWRWVAWDEMPQPLFLPIRHLKESGYNPFK